MHNVKPWVVEVLLGVALLGAAPASAQGPAPAVAPAVTRGALLYDTHCIACHSTQMHWRDQRVAQDWAGLRGQVRRWQDNAGLGWDDADIDAVALHLNQRFYRFRRPPRQ